MFRLDILQPITSIEFTMAARRKRVNQTPVTTDDTRRPTVNFDPFRYLKETMLH